MATIYIFDAIGEKQASLISESYIFCFEIKQ